MTRARNPALEAFRHMACSQTLKVEPCAFFGSMKTAVSGMSAQANRLSTVSDNIADANTVGYKAASTSSARSTSVGKQSDEGRQNSQGEINSRPVPAKSLRFRVASRPPLTRAIAAIMPSGADIPRP